MGIFSRTRDIIAANVTDLLDRAEDPAKMIRMIIMEMEETLVEVRASAARTIADQKEMKRAMIKAQQAVQDWQDKAELALSKGREDLAKAYESGNLPMADYTARLADLSQLDRVTVIVVTFESAHCLPTLSRLLKACPHVILVDNGSRDGSASIAQSMLPHAQVIALERNLGFGSSYEERISYGYSFCCSRWLW
jgi:hypothetical protein